MATAKKKKEEVSEVKLVSGDLETKLKNNLDTKKEDPEIKADLGGISIVAPEQPKKMPVKMVKVLMADNHKCYIGGEWYYLMKDKQYNVPENVKDILLRSNKLKPL